MLYAIRNKKTRKFITGTDYRYHPPHQITNEYKPPLLVTDFGVNMKYMMDIEKVVRHINLKKYEFVPMKIEDASDNALMWEELAKEQR